MLQLRARAAPRRNAIKVTTFKLCKGVFSPHFLKSSQDKIRAESFLTEEKKSQSLPESKIYSLNGRF